MSIDNTNLYIHINGKCLRVLHNITMKLYSETDTQTLNFQIDIAIQLLHGDMNMGRHDATS